MTKSFVCSSVVQIEAVKDLMSNLGNRSTNVGRRQFQSCSQVSGSLLSCQAVLDVQLQAPTFRWLTAYYGKLKVAP